MNLAQFAWKADRGQERMVVGFRFLQDIIINGLIDCVSQQLSRMFPSNCTVTKVLNNNWEQDLDDKEKKKPAYIFMLIFQDIFLVLYFLFLARLVF